MGAWFVYADGFGANGMSDTGNCVMLGMFPPADCSTVTSPAQVTGPFPPSATGAMCLEGTAAQLLNNDSHDLFGEGIGLYFNNPEPGAGAASTAGFYSGAAYTGISFDITFPSGTPQQNLRVSFPTSETTSTGFAAYWGGATAAGSPVVDACSAAQKGSGANGVCGPRMVACPPLGPCQNEGTCDPASGTCTTNVSKTDGSFCTSGASTGTCYGGDCVVDSSSTATTSSAAASSSGTSSATGTGGGSSTSSGAGSGSSSESNASSASGSAGAGAAGNGSGGAAGAIELQGNGCSTGGSSGGGRPWLLLGLLLLARRRRVS